MASYVHERQLMISRARVIEALSIVIPVVIGAACSAGGGSGKQVSNGGAGGQSEFGVGGAAGIGLGAQGGLGGSAGGIAVPGCTSNCQDFPGNPIIEQGAPPNAPDIFGPADPSKFTAPPPCVLEPTLSTPNSPGALYPANWLRPRVRFETGATLFEIRVHSEVQANDLVVYTTQKQWLMPKEIWERAAPNNGGRPMTFSIRAVNPSNPNVQAQASGDIMVAPVNAGGSLVFWTVKDSNPGPDSSKLFGFSVGEEGVSEVLAPKTVKFTGIIHENGADLRGEYGGSKPGFSPGEVQCIGCHTSTPDGAAVIFTDDWPWDKVIASVENDPAQGKVPGAIPDYLTPGARALLKMPFLGTQSTSPAMWGPGKRRLIASYGERSEPFSGSTTQHDRLIWIDLETPAQISDEVPAQGAGDRQAVKNARNQAIIAAKGTAWDVLTMTGEPGNAVTPDWSNAGDRIVYVSTDKSPNGHSNYDATRADVAIIPYNNGQGGQVQPLSGAADPNVYEYYPAFSPDDKLIAFTRAPNRGQNPDGPYYNRFGEINIIPSGGGSPLALAANAPVACAGDNPSLGLINSCPKWSPHAVSKDGKTYYFLIFSSARKYPGQFDIPRGMYTPSTLDTRSSQLYMAGIVVDEATNTVTTYGAIYLWNQNRLVTGPGMATDVQNSNLTPAWDEFRIPPVIAPPL